MFAYENSIEHHNNTKVEWVPGPQENSILWNFWCDWDNICCFVCVEVFTCNRKGKQKNATKGLVTLTGTRVFCFREIFYLTLWWWPGFLTLNQSTARWIWSAKFKWLDCLRFFFLKQKRKRKNSTIYFLAKDLGHGCIHQSLCHSYLIEVPCDYFKNILLLLF